MYRDFQITLGTLLNVTNMLVAESLNTAERLGEDNKTARDAVTAILEEAIRLVQET